MAARSGILFDREAGDEYDLFQGRKKVDGVRLKWIIFTMNSDKTKIVIEKTSGDTDYESFLQELPEEEPRFAVYDFEYDTGDAGKRQKIVFIHWNPAIPEIPGESIGERRKRTDPSMIFASSKGQLMAVLPGIAGSDIYAEELDDISYDAVLQRVTRR